MSAVRPFWLALAAGLAVFGFLHFYGQRVGDNLITRWRQESDERCIEFVVKCADHSDLMRSYATTTILPPGTGTLFITIEALGPPTVWRQDDSCLNQYGAMDGVRMFEMRFKSCQPSYSK